MQNERVIVLGMDGEFSMSTPDAEWHLIFDGSSGAGRWLLSCLKRTANTLHLVSMHGSLDTGLNELALHAGWQGKRFSIVLTSGERFIRPGKVPAGEILAAHGYSLVSSITAFAILNAKTAEDAADAVLDVRAALHETGVNVGSADPIGEPDTGYCCDLTLPIEGYVLRTAANAIVAEWIGHTGLELSEVVEAEWIESDGPNWAAVIRAFDEAA